VHVEHGADDGGRQGEGTSSERGQPAVEQHRHDPLVPPVHSVLEGTRRLARGALLLLWLPRSGGQELGHCGVLAALDRARGTLRDWMGRFDQSCDVVPPSMYELLLLRENRARALGYHLIYRGPDVMLRRDEQGGHSSRPKDKQQVRKTGATIDSSKSTENVVAPPPASFPETFLKSREAEGWAEQRMSQTHVMVRFVVSHPPRPSAVYNRSYRHGSVSPAPGPGACQPPPWTLRRRPRAGAHAPSYPSR